MSEVRSTLKRDNTISPLRKSWWNPFSSRNRNGLVYRIKKLARLKLYGLTYGYAGRYDKLGDHYGANRLSGTLRDSFESHLNTVLTQARATGEKFRWLDVGPGDVDKFMPYFENLDPENELIELHTIAPHQILPRKLRRYKWQSDERWVANPFYEWKNRLNHHVGAFETYNASKLGEFHLVFSMMGGFVHTDYPRENLLKAAKMLKIGGKAFIEFDPASKDRNKGSDKVISHVRKKLGENYEVKEWGGAIGGGYIEITRHA